MDFTYLRPRRVWEALEDHADRPSLRTVERWCDGSAPAPRWAAEIIRERLGAGISGQQKEPPPWAEALEQRLTETILANRETVIQALAEQAARYGVEQALGEQPPVEPAPETREAVPGPVGRR